jgi:hypothetical protein
MATVGATMGSLSAEEAEMIAFMRASKAKAAANGAPAAASPASPPADDNAQPSSNPASPVEEPPSAEQDGAGALLSDDALLSLDVDAAVAAAASVPPPPYNAAADSNGAAAADDDDADDDDFLDDDDFMAELLNEVAEEPPAAPAGTAPATGPARGAVTFAAAPAQPRARARPATVTGAGATSGSGGILRRREPAAAPAAPAAAAAPGEREDVETSSRLRLQDGRSLGTAAMRGLTAAHPYLSFKDISRQVHDIAGAVTLSEKNWCTIGVVTNKSDKRPTKSGSNFRTLHFTDMALTKGTSVCVLLTSDACNNVRVQEGGVYALLEPEIQQEKRPGGNGFILVVSRAESVHTIGRSKDFIPCRATKKDNTPCGNFVDRRINDLCTCHAEQAFNAVCAYMPARLRSCLPMSVSLRHYSSMCTQC